MNTTCYGYLLDLLNNKDYSENELIKKAQTKSYNPEEIQTAIERLKSLRFLDDYRLANNIVEWYAQSRGHNWLFAKLRSRLIAQDIIDSVLSGPIEMNYLSIKNLVQNKLGVSDLSQLDYQQNAKAYRIIASKGYNNISSILEVIKHLN
jgi:regulatory protein